MDKQKNKFFTKNKVIFAILSLITTLAIITYFIVLFIFNLKPIYGFMNIIFILILFITIIIWSILVVRHLLKPSVSSWLTICIIGISILLLLVISPYVLLFTILEPKALATSTSPSGKNKVVVLNEGFIDAVYKAYPVKYKFFYQYQDNGFVSHHDDGGGADIKIDWLSDNEAQVQILTECYIPIGNTNEGNIIIVKFN